MKPLNRYSVSTPASQKEYIKVDIYPRVYRKEGKSVAASYLDVVLKLTEDTHQQNQSNSSQAVEPHDAINTICNPAMAQNTWLPSQRSAMIPSPMTYAGMLAILRDPTTRIWRHPPSKVANNPTRDDRKSTRAWRHSLSTPGGSPTNKLINNTKERENYHSWQMNGNDSGVVVNPQQELPASNTERHSTEWQNKQRLIYELMQNQQKTSTFFGNQATSAGNRWQEQAGINSNESGYGKINKNVGKNNVLKRAISNNSDPIYSDMNQSTDRNRELKRATSNDTGPIHPDISKNSNKNYELKRATSKDTDPIYSEINKNTDRHSELKRASSSSSSNSEPIYSKIHQADPTGDTSSSYGSSINQLADNLLLETRLETQIQSHLLKIEQLYQDSYHQKMINDGLTKQLSHSRIGWSITLATSISGFIASITAGSVALVRALGAEYKEEGDAAESLALTDFVLAEKMEYQDTETRQERKTEIAANYIKITNNNGESTPDFNTFSLLSTGNAVAEPVVDTAKELAVETAKVREQGGSVVALSVGGLSSLIGLIGSSVMLARMSNRGSSHQISMDQGRYRPFDTE